MPSHFLSRKSSVMGFITMMLAKMVTFPETTRVTFLSWTVFNIRWKCFNVFDMDSVIGAVLLY